MAAIAVLVLAAAAGAAWYAMAREPGAFSEAESRQRVEDALGSLPQDMGAGGKIRLMHGTMDFQEAEWFGHVSGTFEMEWGQDGAMHISVAMKQGFVTVAFDLYCHGGRSILVFDDHAVEERASEIGDCADFSGAEAEVDAFMLSDLEQDSEIVSITSHRDGSITAELANGTERYTVGLDAQGRIVEMAMESEEGHGAFSFVYGARRTIALPTDTVRAPAEVYGSGAWQDGVYRWEALFGGDYPLEEFEVRVLDGADVIAAFPLAAGPQDVGAVRFEFTDNGDGNLSGGDAFVVRAAADHDVVVWDLWADRDVEDDVATPGLAPAALLAVLAAGARRRR